MREAEVVMAIEIERLRDLVRDKNSELNRLSERILVLENALRPFAKEADMYEEAPDSMRLLAPNEDGDIEEIPLTVGDLRRARSSLTP